MKIKCYLNSEKDLLWVYPFEWIFFIRGILTWSPTSSLQGSILYGGAYNRFRIISAISGVTLLGSIPIERFTVLFIFLVISCNTEYQSCVRFSVKYRSYFSFKNSPHNTEINNFQTDLFSVLLSDWTFLQWILLFDQTWYRHACRICPPTLFW